MDACQHIRMKQARGNEKVHRARSQPGTRNIQALRRNETLSLLLSTSVLSFLLFLFCPLFSLDLRSHSPSFSLMRSLLSHVCQNCVIFSFLLLLSLFPSISCLFSSSSHFSLGAPVAKKAVFIGRFSSLSRVSSAAVSVQRMKMYPP